MGKIIVKLSGGLGNQLCQYAFALYLKKITDYEIFIDTKFYYKNQNTKITRRNYELINVLNINNNLYHGLFNKSLYFRLINKKYLNNIISYSRLKILNNNNINNIILDKYNLIISNQVFGTLDQYNIIKNELLKLFNSSKIFINELINIKRNIQYNNSVAVHIRRTDYLNHDSIHHVLDTKYYLESKNKIESLIINPKYYLFGDDHEFIQKKILPIFPNSVIWKSNIKESIYSDFIAMNFCENNIISNSTYSWWAAYLKNESNKKSIIVAPGKWLKNDSLNEVNSLYPNNWITIIL